MDKDKRIAEQEYPHHTLAPWDAFEGPLIRRPIGDGLLIASKFDRGLIGICHCRWCHVVKNPPSHNQHHGE